MWMDEYDLDRAAVVIGRYAPDVLPYVRYLSDWRDAVKRAAGGWDVAAPGAASARDLMALLDRAGRAVRLKGDMPADDEFRAALNPIRAAAVRFGLEAPALGGECPSPRP